MVATGTANVEVGSSVVVGSVFAVAVRSGPVVVATGTANVEVGSSVVVGSVFAVTTVSGVGPSPEYRGAGRRVLRAPALKPVGAGKRVPVTVMPDEGAVPEDEEPVDEVIGNVVPTTLLPMVGVSSDARS